MYPGANEMFFDLQDINTIVDSLPQEFIDKHGQCPGYHSILSEVMIDIGEKGQAVNRREDFRDDLYKLREYRCLPLLNHFTNEFGTHLVVHTLASNHDIAVRFDSMVASWGKFISDPRLYLTDLAQFSSFDWMSIYFPFIADKTEWNVANEGFLQDGTPNPQSAIYTGLMGEKTSMICASSRTSRP